MWEGGREGYMPPPSRRTDAVSVTLPTYLNILIRKEVAELGENKKKDICCCWRNSIDSGVGESRYRVEKPVEYLVLQVVLRRCWDIPMHRC